MNTNTLTLLALVGAGIGAYYLLSGDSKKPAKEEVKENLKKQKEQKEAEKNETLQGCLYGRYGY